VFFRSDIISQTVRQTVENFPKRVGPQVPKLKYGPPLILIADQLKMALILTGIHSQTVKKQTCYVK